MGKYQSNIIIALIFALAIIGAAFIVSNANQLSTQPEPEQPGSPVGQKSVTALWKFQCKDILDEGSAAASGSLSIYDPQRPGEAIESYLSISSGIFTTTHTYASGQQLFLKYNASTYFDWGMLVTIPYWNTEYTSVQTLDHPDIIWVYKRADMLQGSSNTDIIGQKNGASSWTDASTSLSAFNRTADGNNPRISILITNEDDDTAYVDPRGYYDYSIGAMEQRDRKSYLIYEFQPTGTTTSGLNVNDFLKFTTKPSSAIIKHAGTSLFVFFPLTSTDASYIRDVDEGGQTVGEKDGNGVMGELTFDFSGSISTAIGADDIDIEVSFSSGFPMNWFQDSSGQGYETLTGVPGDNPLGEMATVWTNDWSIGW